MEDHGSGSASRIGTWFAANGSDMFGAGTFDRPWTKEQKDPMDAAREKMAAAFEFIEKLGVLFYCFHDVDVAPAGKSFREFRSNLDALADDALAYQERSGARLLWGTANLFTHPRFQAGAATNPDPEVFAHAAAQVKNMLGVHQNASEGANYVLWGGRRRHTTRCSTPICTAKASNWHASSISSPTRSSASASTGRS